MRYHSEVYGVLCKVYSVKQYLTFFSIRSFSEGYRRPSGILTKPFYSGILTVLKSQHIMLLSILQAIFAILTILTILLQGRGTGLGSTFGDNQSFVHTKRGAEKLVFIASIIFAILFLITSLLNVIL